MSESPGISRQVMVMSLVKLEMIKCENNVFSGCVDRYNLSADLGLTPFGLSLFRRSLMTILEICSRYA